jgi:hypothetical protein
MICLFKNRNGIVKFGDYAVAPNEATYNSLAEIPNNSYASLTAEQLERYNINSNDITYIFTGVETPTPEPTLEELKAIKLNSLNGKLKIEVDKGYTYNTWNYPISENTVNNIIKQETLIKIAERKDVIIDSFQLTDGSNVDRIFTLAQYSDFALGYAVITAKIEKWYANKRNLILNASTQLELEEINIDFV